MEGMRRVRLPGIAAPAVAAVLVVALALAGCAGDDESIRSGAAKPQQPVVTTEPSTTTASESPGESAPLPTCPNPEGGSCLGALRPRTPYSTVEFQPAITYEVPVEGWKNFEDVFGNFLLVPPGAGLEGVRTDRSDYVGVYRAVLPSRLTSPVCGAEWPLGEESGPTPREMLRYYRGEPNLVVSNVRDAEVGGLVGIVLDLEAARDRPLDSCQEGTAKVEVTSVISGVDGASLDHGVVRDMTMRLYLLRDAGRVLAIELTDVRADPGTMDDMVRVAESLEFATLG